MISRECVKHRTAAAPSQEARATIGDIWKELDNPHTGSNRFDRLRAVGHLDVDRFAEYHGMDVYSRPPLVRSAWVSGVDSLAGCSEECNRVA